VVVWPDSTSRAANRRALISPYGYLLFFVGTLITVILANGPKALVVLLAVLVFAGLLRPRALKVLARWRLWAFIVPTLLISLLVIGERDLQVWGLRLSTEGFWLGMWMAVRALCIALAASILANTVSVTEMAQLFERMRLKGLGFAVGVAMNMLPTVRGTMENSYQAMRLRGGFRTNRLQTLRLLVVSVIAGSLRRGDDIVSAAESRAFDPSRPLAPTISVTRGDIMLGCAICVLCVALLLL
jgi:energy-coupling factor transporter transmembrane protein EcfT